MKYIRKITLLSAVVVSLLSCNQDLVPTNSIAKDQAFQNYVDAEKFANGMNSYFRSIHYGLMAYTGEVQTDMYNASTDYGNRNGGPHKMDASFTSSDYNLRDYWRACYKAIMSYNNYLENCDKIVGQNDKEIADLKVLKGYAHFYRAATYHMLIKNYAKSYDASTAASDLGVPLIDKFDIALKPARATVAEVYKFINDDIAAAKANLAGVTGAIRSETPTIDAVTALDARVKLFMKDWVGAAAAAGSLIATNKYKLTMNEADMTAEWVNDNGSEDIMQMYASLTEYGTILAGSGSGSTRMAMDIYLGWSNGASLYTPDFIPTKTCVDNYEEGDLRLKSWFLNAPVQLGGVKTNVFLLNKYPGNPVLFTAPTRNYAQKAKVFRIAEMYLTQAEALVNSGNADQAKTVLNALQNARQATPTEATVETVRNEWAKETIGEGFRLDCMRRWGIGFTNRVPQNELIVQNSQGFTKITVPANDFHFVWAIPNSEVNTNPNLVQNPGWGIN